jgi:hypothetical protein
MRRRIPATNSVVLAFFCVAIVAGGCARRTIQASAPVGGAPAPSVTEVERPMTIAPDTDASPPSETAPIVPPVVAAEESATPPVNIPATRAPNPRRPPEPTVEAAVEPPAKKPAPVISPQLSPADQANYEKRTSDDVSVAEKNLQGAQGKQLNASQQDIVDKVRSFLTQARDASKSGDWARAQNLAQKARLISIELINSL